MRKIVKVFIFFVICFCFSFSSFAGADLSYTPGFPADIKNNGYDYIIKQGEQKTGGVLKRVTIIVYFKHTPSFMLISNGKSVQFSYPDGGSMFYTSYLEGNPSWSEANEIGGTSFELANIVESSVDIVLDDGTLLFPANSGSSSDQGYAYDSSIPTPKNLMFTTREEGGNFIIAGTKYYGLSWTPPVDDTLMCRIDANVTGKTTGQGGVAKTQYVRLAGENPDLLVSADSGKYEFTVGQIEDKIGGHLGKLDYLRLQYYRLKEGKIVVGPISTVRLKLGLFGKYTYVVTTEYPNDESDVGSSGGLDDTYHDKWTSDGENYYEYDQDGNLIDSGTNSTGSWSDALKGLIDSLLNIPTIITRLFGSLSEMMSGIGALPAYFAQVVTWLPSEITALISLGIVVVIALRIFGR